MKETDRPGVLVKILLILLIFWGLYTPIANLIGSVATSLSFVVFDVLLFIYLVFSKIEIIKIVQKTKLLELLLAIFVASVYVAFRSAFSGNDSRIFQNLQIEVQIIYFFELLLVMYYRFRYSKYEIMLFFLNVVMIQGSIAISMLFLTNFHNVALHLYYAGSTENAFISAKRIYGLSSEYTFTTPIVNGIFGVIAVFFSLKKSKLYLLYLPIILLLVLLNGRTGLVVFGIGSIIIIFKNAKRLSSLLILSASSAFGIYLTFYLLKTLSQDTYVWIISFFSDTLNLINGDATGNYTQLGMQLPKDNLLFGYGFRIYDLNTILSNITIYQRSDIGYANDLFLGGIVYIILLYIPILFYVYLSTANDNKFKGTGLSFFLVIALLIADYKGETMRNGNLLLLVITLSMLFRIPKRKKEIDER
ncbi:hypothetical protein QMA60_10355 [Leuconostoc suionicum]|uniref:hypothetical protein n=2 Tax=Leuconostoc suionicum TaxID=1511761 RepID=UPI0024AD5F84|nr:hypothetical protein [Leuconostoc suionicum]MDI6498961.1 hypothetical protein [Leuconostoc suionicum]MDI6501056.1 hypothetical protein [Leuconostoc suionicum]MDI6503140.1 hypothetical protein [Leuconostoc suionicum]MDI6615009.1 hypothetical protein [Leuconostoc suionicum]MDI6666014.1 hypothetical protein [Leuconostoc suionicum]